MASVSKPNSSSFMLIIKSVPQRFKEEAQRFTK
jgi:hypothetical protein